MDQLLSLDVEVERLLFEFQVRSTDQTMNSFLAPSVLKAPKSHALVEINQLGCSASGLQTLFFETVV